MSRDEQIEEMAKLIRESDISFVKQRVRWIENDLIEPLPSRNQYIAIALTEKGYRKASEVAREIFEEIEKSCRVIVGRHIFNGQITCYLKNDIAELKNKYTEEVK